MECVSPTGDPFHAAAPKSYDLGSPPGRNGLRQINPLQAVIPLIDFRYDVFSFDALHYVDCMYMIWLIK